jgi:tryptophan halogenase
MIDRFNGLAAREIEEIRDFLILHYYPTRRRDSAFWRHVSSMDLPPSLVEKVALFTEQGRILGAPDDLFTNLSWVSVMHGMGIAPRACDPLSSVIPPAFAANVIAKVQAQIAAAADAAPGHDAFLKGGGLLAA